MNNINHDTLLCAEHDTYGIWYFTNRKKVERALGIVQPLQDYHMRKSQISGEKTWKIKGWTFSWVENGDDIIYKYINPEYDKFLIK